MQHIDLSGARLEKISVHYIGNKGNGQELITSKAELALPGDDRQKIKNSFLERFSLDMEQYRFHHPSSLDFNEVYKYALESFAETDTFHQNSVNIARHLFENTLHPKIKAGELYVCYYSNCMSDGAYMDAIGLYKTENKSEFLDLDINAQHVSLVIRNGVEAAKFDKGCLILPTNAEQGFDVLILDTHNKGEEAVFWREGFLSVQPAATDYYNTNQFLNVARQFISKQLTEEREIPKTEQIALLNKSVDYFKNNNSFEREKFEREVFEEAGLIKSFKDFEGSYCDTNGIELADSFDISTPALKKQVRAFKSILKLDKNFHVYIHGDKSLIEKGYDAKVGKNYYKIYFDEET